MLLSTVRNKEKEGKLRVELTDEIIRGIAGFWIHGVDSINLTWFHILCNIEGRERNTEVDMEGTLSLKGS